MEYKDFFSPNTLAKLNKQSAENLKQMLGDKDLMQTVMSSQQLLGQIAKAEAPYKNKLEKLAMDIVKELYPIIDKEGITIDAKIVPMSDINKSLDEIKINLPIHSGLKIGEKYSLNFWNKENTEWSPQVFIFKGIRKPNERELKLSPDVKFYYVFQNGENSVSFPSTKNWKFWKQEKIAESINEIKINDPVLKNILLNFEKEHIKSLSAVDEYRQEEYILKKYKKKFPKYWPKIEEWLKNYWQSIYGINESISPESRRRIINAITQGAAVRGSFAFYLFKEHLDEIDPSLIDKYDEIMKNTFGVYDDENAIAMFLAMIAQGHKAAGGSSKVIINEVKINEPGVSIKKVKELWNWFHEDEISKNKGGMGKRFEVLEKYSKFLNSGYSFDTVLEKLSKEKIYKLHNDLLQLKNQMKKNDLTEAKELGITIQARAINFPMLVHEIVKGLFELISLQGFKDSKEKNQQIVDKVDILKNEPYDLKYGKFIYDALRNIVINNNAEPKTIPYFFAEVYKMDNEEFIEFIENSILEKLTPEQQRWVKITIKEIEDDLKADATGLDEVKIENPNIKLYQISPQGSGVFKNYRIERTDGSEMIDMFFDSYGEAEKYAIKKGLKIKSKNLDEVKIQLNNWKLILKNIIKDDKLENLSYNETAEYDVNSKNKSLYNFLITNQHDSYNPYLFEDQYFVYWVESKNKIIIETIL